MPPDPRSSDFSQFALVLNEADTVAIAKVDLPAGALLARGGASIRIANSVPAGHKFALRAVRQGEVVLRYGQKIGVAVREIGAGEWVHTHNLAVGDMSREFEMRIARLSPERFPAPDLCFQGYQRANGLYGTRNFIAVISTVSCSAQTARAIAHAFPAERLALYPNIDGVVAVTHTGGCCAPPGSADFVSLQRILGNLTRHPNIGGAVFVGLGCEGNQMQALVPPNWKNKLEPGQSILGPYLDIQDCGGIGPTVRAGIEAVERILPLANRVGRAPAPLSALKVALQCGGSDGWSGVTANPLVGQVSDRIAAAGGTLVLAETPEIVGGEQLLLGRLASWEAGRLLVETIRRWQKQADLLGFSLDNNPSPGNKKGGLTTIFEKSLGAVAKGGSGPLVGVYEYGEWVDQKGLVFMDTPGYDPAAVTGQIAGGCNLVLFTTGRGSVFGSFLAPCLKIASNTEMYQRMSGDMDYNAGSLLEGKSMQAAADELLELTIAAASGTRPKSEQTGFREMEFIPWQTGPTL